MQGRIACVLTSYAVNIVREHSVILLPPAATMPIHLYPVASVFDDGVGGWRSSGLGSWTIKRTTTCPVPCQTLTFCQHVHAAADNQRVRYYSQPVRLGN